MAETEYCNFCGADMDGAGRLDGVVRIDTEHVCLGPICAECWGEIAAVVQSDLESQTARLRRTTTELSKTVAKLPRYADTGEAFVDKDGYFVLGLAGEVIYHADLCRDALGWRVPSCLYSSMPSASRRTFYSTESAVLAEQEKSDATT